MKTKTNKNKNQLTHGGLSFAFLTLEAHIHTGLALHQIVLGLHTEGDLLLRLGATLITLEL